MDSCNLTIHSLEESIIMCKDIFAYGLALEKLGARKRQTFTLRACGATTMAVMSSSSVVLGSSRSVPGFDHRMRPNFFTSAARI